MEEPENVEEASRVEEGEFEAVERDRRDVGRKEVRAIEGVDLENLASVDMVGAGEMAE